ncbi:DNA-binding protein [Streptomyces sp. NBC_01571]|uniref:helix-turn-helix transcriptional regulator n=1 Tax=Streptomyces sp. NBC_01571 TaxID=2975883 RepID=UPI00225978AC|nr:DNA-binding protein [Streptomyces sp. NBC_01571]MCX4579358.1 DNA-binding protein [Streptomyces sp. NBC_01571]
MARPPALKLAEVLAEIRMSPSAFYRLRARGQAPRMIKLPKGELRCRRADRFGEVHGYDGDRL